MARTNTRTSGDDAMALLMQENATPNTDCQETQQLQFKYGEVIPQMLDVLERKYDSPTHPKQQYRTKR